MEQRIEKLERQCRWYRNLFILAGLAVVALVTWGATKPVPEVIQARKFEVVNEEGREVVVIDSWKLGGWITIYPDKGAYLPSISLGHTDDGGGLLEVYNKNGGRGVQMQGMSEFGGGGGLVIVNTTGKPVISAVAYTNGNGTFAVSNKNGTPIFSVIVDPSGGGMLGVNDKHGEPAFMVLTKPNGGILEISNKDNKRVFIAGAHTDGGGMEISNKTGETVIRAYTDEYGNGVVGAYNRKGKGRTLQPGPQ